MDLKQLRKPLRIDEIDFRIQSINKGQYATILAYKDARADMNRLDEVCGVLNWKREHSRDNANCTVSIWCGTKKQWVSKEDTGTESMTEKAKGLASDSFKRACFNLGIGRELYDYPMISIHLADNEVVWYDKNNKVIKDADRVSRKAELLAVRPSWNLKLKEWVWFSQFTADKLTYLAVKDARGTLRFAWGKFEKPESEKTVEDKAEDKFNNEKK